MREFVLTDSHIRSLARGRGHADAIALLTHAQMSRRRLFLLASAERAAATSPQLRAALTLIAEIDRAAPEAGQNLLRHPFLETWFADLTSPATDESTTYLAALAAATAARAGLPFELTLTASDADLVLPGLGVATGVGEGTLTLRSDGSALAVSGDRMSMSVPSPFSAATATWRPAFLVQLPAVALEVDDVDPLRGRFPEPTLHRMAGEELAAFGRALQAAWSLLAAEQPEQAAGISLALRKIVPLRGPADGRQVSASSRACFGAIGMSLPEDPAVMAELILHESRHETLDALLDLVELCSQDGPARLHAPWRPDPRPADALMQGVYAFAGVAEFWRVRRLRLASEAARRADFTFAYWSEQVGYALAQLLRCGELTEIGVVFFTEIQTVLGEWREDSKSAEAAWRSAVAARIGWRLTRQRVDQSQVEALGRAWLRGDADAVALSDPVIVDGPAPDICLSEALREAWLGGEAGVEGVTERERAILRGDVAGALRMPERPRSTRDWIAVATALAISGEGIASHRPEVLRAVFAQIDSSGRAPDVVALARWLDGVLMPAS